MLRFFVILCALLCLTKATFGAVIMWSCEAKLPQTEHEGQLTQMNPLSHNSCPEFPHGFCSFIAPQEHSFISILLVQSLYIQPIAIPTDLFSTGLPKPPRA